MPPLCPHLINNTNFTSAVTSRHNRRHFPSALHPELTTSVFNCFLLPPAERAAARRPDAIRSLTPPPGLQEESGSADRASLQGSFHQDVRGDSAAAATDRHSQSESRRRTHIYMKDQKHDSDIKRLPISID